MTFFLNKFIYNYLHKIENIKKDKYKALEIGGSWLKDLCV